MKKLYKISLEEKMKKLDLLSNEQLNRLEGGDSDSIHFTPSSHTPPVTYTFTLEPPSCSSPIIYF